MKVNGSGDSEGLCIRDFEKGSLDMGKTEKGAKSGSVVSKLGGRVMSLNEKENALGHQDYL